MMTTSICLEVKDKSNLQFIFFLFMYLDIIKNINFSLKEVVNYSKSIRKFIFHYEQL